MRRPDLPVGQFPIGRRGSGQGVGQRNGLVSPPVLPAGPSAQPDVGAVWPRRQQVLLEGVPGVGRPELPSGIAQRVISHRAGACHVTLALVSGKTAVVQGDGSVGIVPQRGSLRGSGIRPQPGDGAAGDEGLRSRPVVEGLQQPADFAGIAALMAVDGAPAGRRSVPVQVNDSDDCGCAHYVAPCVCGVLTRFRPA